MGQPKAKHRWLMKSILLLLVPSLLLSTTGCSQNTSNNIKTVLKTEIHSFYDNLLLKDLNSLMKQFNPSSESYYNHYKEFRNTFNEYKNSYQLNGISFLEVEKKEAKVSVNATVTGVHTETEEPLSYEAIHTFVFRLNEDKEWKIIHFETNYNIPY